MRKEQILKYLELAKQICEKQITCEPDIGEGLQIALDFFKRNYMSFYDIYPHHLERDVSLFGGPVDWTQVKGIKKFSGVDHEVFMNFDIFQSQTNVKFYNANERQNNSPTIDDFYEFMSAHEEFKAHGYCRAPSHKPTIVIEGLEFRYQEGQKEDQVMVDALENWCYKVRRVNWKAPDQFVANEKVIRCWWD